MLFTITPPGNPDENRCQCYCGNEYANAQGSSCPACGRIVPRAVSVENGPWKTYQKWKIEGLQRMLGASALGHIPPEHRESIRTSIKRQIRQLEDGSWKAEAKRQLRLLQRMLEPKSLGEFPASELHAMEAGMASQAQRLREELESAGEAVDDGDVPEARYFTGEFKRPRVTSREWDEDLASVLQKITAAIALHIQPGQWTATQRSMVLASYYFRSISDGGGLGEILFNASTEPDQSVEAIQEALQSVCTPQHAAVFEKARAQWNSKPRDYAAPPSGNREQYAAWVDGVFRPMCEEFEALNREAITVTPALENCVTLFLRQHRDEFVEIVERM